MMPAISFQRCFIDALLGGDKLQTTRKLTNRIKVGDICNIYIEQRKRITDKPLRVLTIAGIEAMHDRGYPFVPEFLNAHYHAHFIGKVYIIEVHDMIPVTNSTRSAWAKADGFTNFTCADIWFTDRYGEDWASHTWTVIKWAGWAERYFEPENP